MENGTSVFHTACYALPENKRGHMREDALFSACALLAVAGFLLSPLEDFGGRTANALLFACKLAFGVLSWTVLAALCARNPFGSIVFLACGELADASGILLGAELGDVCNAVSTVYPKTAALMTSAIVLVFFTYALIGLRRFSFAETIRGIEEASPLPPQQSIPPSQDHLIETTCQSLAMEHSLTNREHEVLGSNFWSLGGNRSCRRAGSLGTGCHSAPQGSLLTSPPPEPRRSSQPAGPRQQSRRRPHR